MVLDPKQTTIAYRCPACGQGVKSIVGVFGLTGSKMRLKCACGGSALEINRNKDEKYKISVPCMLCGNDHKFTLSASTFFEKELFQYPCTYSGINTCFIGNEERVGLALEDNEKEVIELFKSIGVEDPAQILANTYDEEDKDEIEDTDVLDTIVFVLRDLLDTNSITCGCSEPDYDFLSCNGYIKVYCKSCRKSADIPAKGKQDAENFLECYELRLK